ncbi:Dehydrogenase/reductase SDR family member on chromosome X [Amphibalanus amphitrite]|uniref:Dehydrogenase/reductase SDR family member on chromosome X n=1 Tax=Amphibalanus amphitrite TaxID=1232801 RepID=A0A6A4W3Q1_AMPAM|nr:Dehydrogenase/reductase SDR family member on chromosome X [Amphibalanus amphitrite]
MGKKEGKKASTPQVEQAPSEAPVVDETPWWEADFRGRSLDAEGFSWRLYMVREETDSDADLMAMLLSAVRSGVRRQFVLLEQEDVLKLVPEVKKPAPDPKQKAGGKASKREPPASHAVCGMPPEEGMLAAVGEVLRDNGRLDATSLAMVVKHALSLLLTERRAAAGAEDPLPIPTSPEAASAGKAAKKKEVPAKKKKMSTKPEKTAAAEEDKSAEKDKSVDKEDKEFEAFCETRPSTLRKRGEALEPAYKDDEPPDGPDLYVLLVGFGEPRLPRELAACGVHVESLVALGSERCHLRNDASAASSDTDQAGWFWCELPAQLVDPIGGLEDTAVTRVVVDRCRVQFAPSATSAADQVYTAVAYEIYRLLRLRSLFERYVQSVTAVPVPDAPRPPPPPPESPPEEPMAELSVPNTPAGSEVELLEPCVQPPLEYRRLLEPLPPETVTVPLLVNALVEQVCVWAMPVWQRQQETPAPPTPDEPTPEPDCEELERRVALQEEFTPRTDDADRGPVLVYEGDDVNAAFWDWVDREPVLSAEHVLTQTAELQALQGRLPAPSGALWRHQAARQELRAAEGGPRSEPAAELLLRQLVFESMYPALTADCSGGGGGPLTYPHPFLPAQSVRPDQQQLAPECGHGQMEPDAQPLDTGDELLTPPAQFAEFCVSERLDRLTMAQALEAARDGRRRLAAYHFGGDDGLYLVYGHPRVRGGSLSDHWQRRAHTAVGLRDFIEHVQHWPEVRSWMQHQCGQLRNAFAPRQTPPSRPGSAASSAWPSPAELPPPGSGVQLPDAMFLVPGSLKYEASVRQEQKSKKKETKKEKKAEPKKATVTGAGRRLSWDPDAPPEPRPLLTKMATDPVTRELYLQREDGARAVVRPGGQSVLQLADGTRVTISPPPPPPVVAGAEPRPPGCSDYLVNESGWIGAATVTWLLGAQVTVDDATCAQRSVTIEHPEYARVEMDQAEARCRVRLPRGLLVEADSTGFFYLSQPDGSRQVELETVMAERPELFVLYRHGDGVRLMASDEAERYLEDVESTPGALAVQEPHQQDDELTVVKTFRPVGTTLAERWRVPYREATIVPPNLRCRDLQLLCRDAEPPQAGATVWGGGEPVAGAGSPPPPRLPSGLVCTRELLVSPPLPEPRRLAVLRAVNALRLRWRSESDSDGQLPADEPPLTHVPACLRAGPTAELAQLDGFTVAGTAVDIRELDKILIYREMLRRRRFPGFFLTADGRQFLATLRQTPPEKRPAPARRRLKHEPLRLVAAARGEPPLPPVGSWRRALPALSGSTWAWMAMLRSAAVLTRDNVAFLMEGVPIMYRELLFPVKKNADLVSQDGRVAVITGGSRGIGLEAVKTMLKLNMHLIVGSSNPDKASKTLLPLATEAGGQCKLEVWPLDLTKQESVRAFCQRFIDSGLPLHVLLCNAGIMFYPKHELTEDGFEMQMAVNHLGHFTMQHMLYPRLRESGTPERKARIVNVSSTAHNCCSGMNFDDIMLSKVYSPKGAYFQSKGAQILCTKYLANKAKDSEDNVTCCSLHPGVIYTDLYDYTTLYKMASPVLKKLWKSPQDGAETLLYACLSPESEGVTGAHFENAAVYRSARYTEDKQQQEKMWQLSRQLCKVDAFKEGEL